MTKIYAELNGGIRFHYDSETDKASIAKSIAKCPSGDDIYDVIELTIEDLRTLNRYLDHVLQIKEQRKWEEVERGRGCKICHGKE